MKTCTSVILAGLLLVAIAVAPNFALARTATSNVGNWLGEYQGQDIEMALWFDPDPMQLGYVRGYILNRDEQCAIGLFGYRTASVVTTFFSIINDNTLSDYGVNFEIRAIDLEGVNTSCNPLGKLKFSSRLMFVYEPELGAASLAAMGEPAQDENRYNNVVRVMSLKRSTLSPTMEMIVAANPTIDRERGQQISPTAAVRRLFDDPTLDPATVIPLEEVPCRVLIRDQQVRSYAMGIRGIAGTREPGGKLGVRYTQYNGPVPSGVWPEDYRASGEERYVQLDAASVDSPALLNLPSTADGLKLRQEGCQQAGVIDNFLTAIEGDVGGTSAAQPQVAQALPQIEKANDVYFFDVDGIDQIKGMSMTRVYGTTTLFVPGDRSREGRWQVASQSMRMRPMVKHSATGFIEADLLSPFVDVSFYYDQDLSAQTGSNVWVSVEDERQGDVCVRWTEKHFVDNCAERSTIQMHENRRYYMTESIDAAKEVFQQISPQAVTLSAAELADPTRPCESGVFCDMPGGIYLNAVYEGNFGLIQALDKQVRDAGIDAFDRALPGDSLTEVEQRVYRRTEQARANAFLKNLMTTALLPTSSLPYLAKRYMYQFQAESQACFKVGHRVIEKEWIIPPSRTADTEYNGYFIPGDVVPGSRYTANYDINPEFFALCDRVCDAVKPSGKSVYLTEEDRALSEGIDKIMQEYDCSSQTVQRFERNLIKLTQQALDAGPQAPYVQRSAL